MIYGKNLAQIIIDTNDNITPEAKKAAVDYLATLREAGEKMKAALEDIKLGNNLYGADIETANTALEAWEAANK